MAQFLTQYKDNLEKALYEPGFISNTLAKAEEKTGVKRIYLALGMLTSIQIKGFYQVCNIFCLTGTLGLLSIYLIFGYGAQLLCNAIGFVYPAYVSVKAIESEKKDDDTKWLTYWVVFAFLNTIEFFSDIFLSWFPLYWLVKVWYFGIITKLKIITKYVCEFSVFYWCGVLHQSLGMVQTLFTTE